MDTLNNTPSIKAVLDSVDLLICTLKPIINRDIMAHMYRIKEFIYTQYIIELKRQREVDETQDIGDPCTKCGLPLRWDLHEQMIYCENDWRHL